MHNDTLRGIKQAYYKYINQIGKWNKQDALILLEQLRLVPEATEIVREVVLETFEKDAFAGMLRTEAISIRLQVILAREGVKV